MQVSASIYVLTILQLRSYLKLVTITCCRRIRLHENPLFNILWFTSWKCPWWVCVNRGKKVIEQHIKWHMESVCVYRKLLRAIRKHVTNDPSKSSFRDYISQEFRKHAKQNADKDTVKKNLQLAEDYALLISSVHHHKVSLRH